jgi:hypothetical protein
MFTFLGVMETSKRQQVVLASKFAIFLEPFFIDIDSFH